MSEVDLHIPKHYKRRLRQELYYVMKYGLISHISKRKIGNPLYFESLYGKLLFWLMVEPDNEFALKAYYELNC